MMFDWGFGRAKDDPEKAVLPTIIYCGINRDQYRGRSIGIGWWDFFVRIVWVWRVRP